MDETPPPAHTGPGAPVTSPNPGGVPAQTARPRFSETQAAKVTGKSRSVIQRAREKGAFPNAERLEKGWAIPVEDLLAAGFDVVNGHGRPIDAPPAHTSPGAPAASPNLGGGLAQNSDEVKRLQEELHRREVELAAEKARREVLERAATDAQRAFESYQAQLERSFRLIEVAQAEASQARAEAKATHQAPVDFSQPAQAQAPKETSTGPALSNMSSDTSQETAPSEANMSNRIRRWWRN